MTGPPAPGQPRHAAARDSLLVLLTLTTGAIDASCFLHLGNVFSSVITGNLVLLGLSAATLRATLAVHSAAALAGYSAGVLTGAPTAARRAPGEGPWPPSVTVTLLAEFAVVAGLVARNRQPGLARNLGVLAAIVAGAALGGLVTGRAPAWLPAVILTPLAAVVAASVAGFRR